MKLLHIIPGLEMGGAETVLVQLSHALQSRGIVQQVVSLGGRGSYSGEIEANGIEVTHLGLRRGYDVVGGIVRLTRLVASRRPDLIQGWMYHGNIAAAISHRLAPGRKSRRLYWNLRASNVDAERYRWVVAVSARLSRWPDAVVANSVAGADYHVKMGFAPRRLEVITNGVDAEKFCPDPQVRAAIRSELGIAGDKVVVIHVARVDPMKDHAAMLDVAAQLPHIEAVLVGKGTENLKVPANVRALGLRHDVARLCAAADIVVSTSRFGEGFSNALAEGMSCGLVPVATDVGDARSIVGDTGHIVAPGDIKGLVAKIQEEASANAALRQSRGLRARERMIRLFTLDRVAESFARLYGA